jgi:flagellar motor switch/type III secretory pathway protein FliN
MASTFDRKGALSAVFAKGWISAWEVSRLRAGDIVLGSTKAGEGAELRFNGAALASGDIVIVRAADEGPSVIAARIGSLARPAMGDPEPDRGDTLVEMLPFELVLAEVSYSLGELAGIGIGSLVSLDLAYPPSGGLSVSLRIAGVEAARGRCVVAGELFGIVLDELGDASLEGAEPRSSGSIIAAPAAGGSAKIYDWTRPDVFTKATLAAVETIHRRALETMTARWPELAGCKVDVVDQLTIGEWLEDPRSRGSSMLRFRMDRFERSYERERTRPRRFKAIVCPAEPRFSVSPRRAEEIRYFGEGEEARMGERIVLAFGSGSCAALLVEAEAFLSILRSGWKLAGDLRFADPEPLTERPALAKTADPQDPRRLIESEMIVLVSLRGPGGELHLAYSGRAVYPLMQVLDRYGSYELSR